MKHTYLAIPLLALAAPAWAQAQTISGRVLDPSGPPIIGATVVEIGTNNGTGTDAEGRFVLKARTAQPRLRALGYNAQEVPAGEALTITLKESSTALDGVEVVGSRSLNRSATDSPSPVDIIDVQQVTAKIGQLDVN